MSGQNIKIMAFVLLMIFTAWMGSEEYRKEKKITAKLILFFFLFLLATGFGVWDISKGPEEKSKDFSRIAICPEVPRGINPIILPTSNPDSFVFEIDVCNRGTVEVIDMHDHMAGVEEFNGQWEVLGDGFVPAFGKNDKLEPGEFRRMDYSFAKIVPTPTANFFMYFKMLYNSSLGKQDSVVGTFILDLAKVNAQLNTANVIQQEKVEKLVLEKKGW